MLEKEELVMPFTPCLEERFRDGSEIFGLTRYLVLTVLFDSKKDRRIRATNQLQCVYENRIRGIIVGDNQIFLDILQSDNFCELFYLCEKPKNYSGKPIKTIYQGSE